VEGTDRVTGVTGTESVLEVTEITTHEIIHYSPDENVSSRNSQAWSAMLIIMQFKVSYTFRSSFGIFLYGSWAINFESLKENHNVSVDMVSNIKKGNTNIRHYSNEKTCVIQKFVKAPYEHPQLSTKRDCITL
jgi:hypothetical protein